MAENHDMSTVHHEGHDMGSEMMMDDDMDHSMHDMSTMPAHTEDGQ